MDAALRNDLLSTYEQDFETRDLIIAGIRQVESGEVKDFNSVCDRLERKYRG